jgi:hypothetical protein
MANVFIHFEPIGPVGEEIDIDVDLPNYVIRGELKTAVLTTKVTILVLGPSREIRFTSKRF